MVDFFFLRCRQTWSALLLVEGGKKSRGWLCTQSTSACNNVQGFSTQHKNVPTSTLPHWAAGGNSASWGKINYFDPKLLCTKHRKFSAPTKMFSLSGVAVEEIFRAYASTCLLQAF